LFAIKNKANISKNYGNGIKHTTVYI